MTRRCELTGKQTVSGQNRSHAENKSKRKFRPNLCDVTLISDMLGRNVKLRISAHALKSVEHRGGLDKFLMKAKADEMFPGIPMVGGGQAFINKGSNGRWRDVLGEVKMAEYEARVVAELGPDCASWLETGKV